MKSYIGLTIGPIYKTLQNAKKTRELWGASYIFSYIMKRIIKEFKGREFIIPYVNENDSEFKQLLNDTMPVGVFHDRLIFETRTGDFERLQKSIDAIMKEVSQEIAGHIKTGKNTVTAYLQKYFQLYFCEVEYDSAAGYKEINEKMNFYLDSFELQQGFISEEERNFVAAFLQNINGSFLIKEAFGKESINFRSIPEIATVSLGLKSLDERKYKEIFKTFDENDKKQDYDIYLDIEEKFRIHKIVLMQCQRYIAIVHADGDNIGNTISGFKDDDEFKEFSKRLFQFDLSAHKEIETFGGQTIFAGGDDLLFFAPVVNGGKTIFGLLEQIDEKFNDNFGYMAPRPTISFGVSISYYKFPLYEALNISRDLLQNRAKAKNKNAVAFRLLKHSGQYFGEVFEKGSVEYVCLMHLLQDIIEPENGERMMSSIIHNIFAHGSLLELIGDDKKRLQNYFNNNFNEAIHKTPQNMKHIQDIQKLILAVFQSGQYNNNKEKIRAIYSALRLNKFMRE